MSAPISFQVFLGLLLFVAVFVPLEHCFPGRPQSRFRFGWFTDVIYYVAGCFVGKLSDGTSVLAMVFLRRASGIDVSGVIASQPGWVQFFELILTADFFAYVCHRALHRNRYLWRLHQVHHGSQDMDWLANVHLHPVDKFIGDCFQFIPIFLLGFSDVAILAYTIFLGFQGFLNHSNVRLNYGPLRWIIASPQFHHWHHCSRPEAYDRNFSPHLVIFDRLFGTFYLPEDSALPREYGVAEPVPDGFLKQMIHPFTAKASARTSALLPPSR